MQTLFAASLAAIILLSAFNTKKKGKLELPEGFAYIPEGKYYDSEKDSFKDTRTGKTTFKIMDSAAIVQAGGYYISKYEVSNLQYREFYKAVSATLSQAEKEKIACDTLGWRQELSYNEPMVEYYYQHPAYNNYPAVNISYEGAETYCKWLQQKIILENPGFDIEVRLPNKTEWIYAAQGGRSQALFPWREYYFRNKKGEYMCNFKKVGDGAIYRNRATGKPEVAESSAISAGGLNDRAFYTAEVKSFYPNDWGLYNMCGNAAEMIIEKGIAMGGSWNDYGGDVHIKAEAKYEGPQPTIGFRPMIIVTEKKKN
jgi:hypothetical protein